ncbi:hypothetical protein IWX78_002288 [Mycetocola sp. CAN_C7]|uniref:DUF4245 domain-containing protein n=1 Tax=Mycetocola sp. CAN_C7 TaxID=2787724 RepID=UPI0018C90854
MSPRRPPRVVAELGRPETPEETAARKAENSRNYRNRKTVNNLVYSLLVCVALVAIIALAVPRSDTSLLEEVDYRAVAAEAQAASDFPLADPELPGSWSSNRAETDVSGGVSSWNIGLISPTDQYLGITQGFDANETWLSQQLRQSAASATVVVDGIEWTVYDNRERNNVGNVEYALTTQAGASTFVLFGTASDDEFLTVAAALADQVRANDDTAGGE